ncbi:MarR family winged helix-turn-helix transcriptional regulator [Phytoactinopolyspora endophytica]|uniref:MarR family winged helix-turn-helix transcriptional regulator n=1 Tax=Phytoactinopolyspora endophytica TaxID=1642495 RepID=UPI00101D7ED6|nr:MarR family transcriptional regulator [Phytoactinopolyspora endophytica]
MADSVDKVLGQWRAERPDIDASPMGVIGRISRAARFLERKLEETFAAYDLQRWEFDILATLRRSGSPYQLTAGGLVESSMVTSGAITNRIDRLAAKELVTRETDPSNRRSVLITLTDQGRQLVDVVVAKHVENETQLLAALNPGEQEQLADLLRTLLMSLGDVPPALKPSDTTTADGPERLQG